MAEWRKRACALFGHNPGQYSYSRGKVDLLADLVEKAKEAIRLEDEETLVKICDYVCWGAEQKSEQLESAVDLAFFLPVLRDHKLCDEIKKRIPPRLFSEKQRILSNDPISK